MFLARKSAEGFSSAVGSLLNVHGDDYEEMVFQRKLRAQQKKGRGGECKNSPLSPLYFKQIRAGNFQQNV